ncbi:FABP family protein [Massilia sp. TS11]|uniref:FABP family protein n=1 Tax=Massilia sp. TS11 TaxID=2908003 RepID=UPI001EDBF28F|nr:heme-binding beta-barrel domain-containing protein [Massilia sp. TS11]MCG2585057.1 heme-binding beta-barrel domain-containing protein [Massilia sp. TS11]
MHDYPDDIYTEPAADTNTLAQLGPLAPLAGVWEGQRGLDVKPKADGPRKQAYVERIEMQPIDPVTNGPQLFYGLRYTIFITKPNQTKTYHEQNGYFLWEPLAGVVIQTLSIPRGMTAMASGEVAPDARQFTLVARGPAIASNPFLQQNFNTTEYRITISIHEDGSWSYESDTVMDIRGQAEPFHHTDRNTLSRVGAAEPNPLARS